MSDNYNYCLCTTIKYAIAIVKSWCDWQIHTDADRTFYATTVKGIASAMTMSQTVTSMRSFFSLWKYFYWHLSIAVWNQLCLCAVSRWHIIFTYFFFNFHSHTYTHPFSAIKMRFTKFRNWMNWEHVAAGSPVVLEFYWIGGGALRFHMDNSKVIETARLIWNLTKS